YIEHLYYLEGWMPFRHEKVLPVPALDLKINLGDVFYMYEGNNTTPVRLTESWLVGLYGVHHRIDWPSEMRLYGIRFKPNGAYPCFRFPVSEIYNQVVTLDAIWGQLESEIREQLPAVSSMKARFVLVERLLLLRFCENLSAQKIVDQDISVMIQ